MGMNEKVNREMSQTQTDDTLPAGFKVRGECVTLFTTPRYLRPAIPSSCHSPHIQQASTISTTGSDSFPFRLVSQTATLSWPS